MPEYVLPELRRGLRRLAKRAISLATTALRLAEPRGLVLSEQIGLLRRREHGELRLRYLGRRSVQRELRFFFVDAAAPARDLAAGGLLLFGRERMRLERSPEEHAVIAVDALEGLLAPRGGWFVYHPYLRASLPLQDTFEAQLAAVGAKRDRRRLRTILDHGLRVTVSRRAEDFHRFYDTMFLPLIHQRHKHDPDVVPRQQMNRVFTRAGSLILIHEGEQAVAGVLVYTSEAAPNTLFCWRNGIAGAQGVDNGRLTQLGGALDAATLRYAIEKGYRAIDFGACKALLNDGIFAHKRHLGCDFRAPEGSPRVLLRIGARRLRTLVGALPLIVEGPQGLEGHLAVDGDGSEASLRALRSTIEVCCFPSLRRLTLHPSASLAGTPGLRPAIAAMEREIGAALPIAAGL